MSLEEKRKMMYEAFKSDESLDVVKALLEKGFSIKDMMIFSCSRGYPSIVSFLLENGFVSANMPLATEWRKGTNNFSLSLSLWKPTNRSCFVGTWRGFKCEG